MIGPAEGIDHLEIRLFGKYTIKQRGADLGALGFRKVQELLAFLLVHAEREYSREMLAGVLWADASADNARAYLRKALWQLQTAFDPPAEPALPRTLLVQHDWLRLNPEARLWCDVVVFQQGYRTAQGVEGQRLDREGARALREAVNVYRGDLLDGWYEDWCQFERERLQTNYLGLLDKLIAYGEREREYEQAIADGARILEFDRAREHTHRALMRLHALAGDRAAAVRQFENCATALDEELGIPPSPSTVALLERIKSDQSGEHELNLGQPGSSVGDIRQPWPSDVLQLLRRLRLRLSDVQLGVQQELQAVEQVLRGME